MEIKVTGIKELERNLLKLANKDATRVLRRGMQLAAKQIVEQAKENAGNIAGGSGALRESIGSQFHVGSKLSDDASAILPSLGGRFSMIIGPLRRARTAVALYNLYYRRRTTEIFHGHFVEFGTKKSRAQPFLKPALEAKAQQAVRVMADEIKAGIARLLK